MTQSETSAADTLGPEQTYFHHLKAGTWKLPRCRACGKACFYPRISCPACGGAEFDWFTPSGKGVVHSTTIMRRAPDSGGDLNLCLVDLEEGVRMMSRVVECDPGQVRIGARVQALAPIDGDKVVFILEEKRA